MTSAFLSSTGSVFVSNNRLASLVSFAIQVGEELASTPAESIFVAKLREEEQAMFPGYDLSLQDAFASPGAKFFWSKVFAEVAVRIGSRTIGNTEPPHEWRVSAQADALAVSRLLLREAGA